MTEIKEILPPHAVNALPNLDWEYVAEQLWVHSQNFINTGVHVFAGGVVIYNDEQKEATVKLNSLRDSSTNATSIIELTISYNDKNNPELTKLFIPDSQTNAYSEDTIEDWSFNARKAYHASLESDPYVETLRVALTMMPNFDSNTLEQNRAMLNELNSANYFHEHIQAFMQKHANDTDFWKRLAFGFDKSGIIALQTDGMDVTYSPDSYDELQAMDWAYELYDRQTPNKPYIVVNEHDQYMMLHVDENKHDRYFATKVEIYTGNLHDTPLEVGVEVYDALSKVKRQRTLDNFMNVENTQMQSKSLKFEPPKDEDRVQRPFWNTLNTSTTWRPATEDDIAKWLAVTPPQETERDGNNQNLLDMYNSAKETWLSAWREYPAGLAASNTADTLYNAEDPDRLDYLVNQLNISVNAKSIVPSSVEPTLG